MKVAILADIHGNAEALISVLREARIEQVELLLIAGDLVGYYYDIRGVFNQLSDWSYISISGNHEKILDEWKKGKNHNEIRSKYGSGIEKASSSLSNAEIDWLIGLPNILDIKVNGKTVLICHGSPRDKNEYIYPDAPNNKWEYLFSQKKDLLIYGHTHYQVIKNKKDQLIVNPGSVGQPRDKKIGACWALWDTECNQVQLKTSLYNVSSLINRCKKIDPDVKYLREVLIR